MDISLFLAKFIGIFMIITSLFVMFRAKALHEVIDEYIKIHSATYFGGFVNLIIGLVLVLLHNVWKGEVWVVVVTVFGWIALLKGVFLLFMPHDLINKMLKIMRHKQSYALLGLINMVIGIYMVNAGFTG